MEFISPASGKGRRLIALLQRVSHGKVEVDGLELRGVVTVDVEAEQGIVIFVFSAVATSTETTTSPEGGLAWFNPRGLPVGEMVKDLPTLIDQILRHTPGTPPFSAHYSYDHHNRLDIHFY